MKVIDAHTGRELREGDVVRHHDLSYRVIKIVPGMTSAKMLVESSEPRLHGTWVPLIVRWTHPGFFLQHVAFVPS